MQGIKVRSVQFDLRSDVLHHFARMVGCSVSQKAFFDAIGAACEICIEGIGEQHLGFALIAGLAASLAEVPFLVDDGDFIAMRFNGDDATGTVFSDLEGFRAHDLFNEVRRRE